jgi:hypothetical protein
MKNHSDNIEILTSIAAILNFNVFEKDDDNQLSKFQSFKNALKSTIEILETRVYNIEKYDFTGGIRTSLPDLKVKLTDYHYLDLYTFKATKPIFMIEQLSIPNFKIENGIYTLYSGLFAWEGMWFKQGCQFTFNELDDIVILTPKLVESVNIVHIEEGTIIHYDYYSTLPENSTTYNTSESIDGYTFTEVDNALQELDLKEDFCNSLGGEGIDLFKCIAFYLPELKLFNGKTIAYRYLDLSEEIPLYDIFTIIFKSYNSVYAYVLDETVLNNDYDYVNTFEDTFNFTNKQGLINIGLENILPNLKEIIGV